ncbi:MAG: hypothetical protein IIZ78_18175 [Clostridiales bacterium]|nr:hypothetical protein [Clostridiales bacterium]
MAYATYLDVQARMSRTLSESEQAICTTLLDDAAVIIDLFNSEASADVKKVVSCRMVIRAIGDGESGGVPVGATQGSMSGLGYSQSWTISSGSTGELYLAKLEKQMLGKGNAIGSYSPVQELVATEEG